MVSVSAVHVQLIVPTEPTLRAFFFHLFFIFLFLFFLFFVVHFLFMKASPMYVDHAHTHAAVASVSAEQQPEGWRFVPDTILPGYQWTPQWVPVRTPTVHWGPISGKAVGGPAHSLTQQCRVQYSSHTAQKHPNVDPGQERRQ